MASELLTGLSIFKTMMDMAKGLKDINDATVRNAAVIELQEKILAAQETQTELVHCVSELEEKMAKMKAWDTEKQRYELKAVDRGTFAYVPKKGMQGSEPPHWLCTNCYNNGHKSFLQFRERAPQLGGGRGDQDRYICGTCQSEVRVHYNKNPSKN